MRCEKCGCTLFSCQCPGGPVNHLVEDAAAEQLLADSVRAARDQAARERDREFTLVATNFQPEELFRAAPRLLERLAELVNEVKKVPSAHWGRGALSAYVKAKALLDELAEGRYSQ